jgi:hypothetical protein
LARDRKLGDNDATISFGNLGELSAAIFFSRHG